MIALALACFLAGLMVGLSFQLHAKEPVYSCQHKDKTPQVTKQLRVDSAQTPPVRAAVPSFRLRPSFVQRRAKWEAAHNTKAQTRASIAEQIRKAQEGTLT